VERKARFIAQIMRGRLDVREIDDIGDTTLSFNEVKALSTGNPLVLDQAAAVAEVTRLERLERTHAATMHRLRTTIDQHESSIRHLTAQLPIVAAAIDQRRPTRGDLFTATINGTFYNNRPDAGAALLDRIATVAGARAPRRQIAGIAQLGGLAFDAVIDQTDYTLALRDIPDIDIRGSTRRLSEVPPTGLMIRLENAIEDLDHLQQRMTATIPALHEQITEARTQLERPFAHADALRAAQDRLASIEREIAELAAPPPAQAALSTQPTDAPAAAPRSTDPAAAPDRPALPPMPAEGVPAARRPPTPVLRPIGTPQLGPEAAGRSPSR
jgi:hypothetical protein